MKRSANVAVRADRSRGTRSNGADPPPTLRVTCFGGFRIAGLHEWERGPAQRRARDVIQYLVLHPVSGATRERLTESLWPGENSDALAHRLHAAVSTARSYLRGLLGGFNAICCNDDGYSWAPSLRVVCDAATFASLYREGSPHALRAAAALYAGELFEGQTAEWLHPPRVKYASMYASIVERLAADALAANRIEEALQFGLALVGVDRAHESAVRLVIDCMGRLGRRRQALAEYESLRAYLARHLGVEPMRETADLIGEVLRPPRAAETVGGDEPIQLASARRSSIASMSRR